ncbi:MAG: hypothetical protein JSU57_03970 [Candidatus Heimdallarchaeota archaeon]|nr:MAG: hypothetical protein JSU57_03970 [Candidatus Heimdallarchaeota archaeon]
MAKFHHSGCLQALIGVKTLLDINLCEEAMKNLNDPLKIMFHSGVILFLLTVVIFPTSAVLNIDITPFNDEEKIQDVSPNTSPNNLKIKLTDNDTQIKNVSFDIGALFNYVSSLYREEGIFREAYGGFDTSTATYEALSILRFLGLDYYQFGSEWEDKEVTIADKLLDLRDKAGSGGYYLSPVANSPSLEGTFGVTTSLWVMNELPLKLKLITPKLLDFVYNVTFDKENYSFHEVGQENCSIKATFQALTILDLIRKVVIIPELYDEKITPLVNETVLDFMADYSFYIFKFLNSSWVNNSYFYSYTPFKTKIQDTWHALQSIKILDEYGRLLKVDLPRNLTDYQYPVINWLKSVKKTIGPTKGGFGTSEYANVSETGIAYAILNLFNSTEEIDINHTETILFIYSSQFLKRENRTYRSSELPHIGGFGPNNVTYPIQYQSKRVNVHDTYFAVLTLLLSGDIFNSINLTLETTHYQEIISKYPASIKNSNYIIQGELGVIEQYFTIFNYKSHGSLELITVVDNWNLTHPEYTESNKNFFGKSNALYAVNLENDSEANFNWTLGSHKLTNIISIRNLPIIQSPVYYCHSSLYVGYKNEVNFNSTAIKPGNIINTMIFFQNRSVLSYSTQNITDGSVSANLTSPNRKNYIWLDFEPINTTIGAINYLWEVPDQALLGTWELTLILHQANFSFVFIIQIEITDTVFFYNMFHMPQYYPGEDMNLNVSLKYTNGNFTPNANASVVFNSNQTQEQVFNLTLHYLQGNVYTTSGVKCPTRFLYGFFNVSISLTWNSTLELPSDPIVNSSLPVIHIKGIPTVSEASYKTNYRNTLPLLENNLFYYGETLNLTLTIGFKFNSTINNVTDESVVVMGGLVNNTQPLSYIQLFQTSYHNNTLSLTGLINTNLPNTTLGTRFQILSEWNNSYVYLRNPVNTVKHAVYNFSLIGTFEIRDINYVATEISDGLYQYALDTTSVISISFQVYNNELENIPIPVPNLNLYGILDIQNKVGTLNQSLPSVTSGVDQNKTMIYLLSIPTSNLSPNNYEISIYTWTAIRNHLKIGTLLPGFSIIKTFSPQPIIQVHEVLILISGLILIVLIYLNVKKFR